MNYCDKCKVTVHSQHDICPLCGEKINLKGKQLSITSYPIYQKKRAGFFGALSSKWATMTSVIAILICVTINFLTNPESRWSLVVAGSIIYEWITIRHTVISKHRLGQKIIMQVVCISLLCLLIDWSTGFTKWAGNYIIPFVVIGVTFTMTLLAMLRSTLWNEYFGYLITLLFVSVVPLLFFVFGLSNVLWTNVSAIIYAGITLVAVAISSFPKVQEEMKKRFHLKQ